MAQTEKINIFWFRRDLRLDDNTALDASLSEGLPVLTVFIFDSNILSDLSPSDARITFIHESLFSISNELRKSGSSIFIRHGEPEKVFEKIISAYDINCVFVNKDYEPYSVERDLKIAGILKRKGIVLRSFRDQVIFEEEEVIKPDGSPYTVFTPYKNAWLRKLNSRHLTGKKVSVNFYKCSFLFPDLKDLGFRTSPIKIPPYDLSHIREYDKYRDFPAKDGTTLLGPHLRFGTVSIRKIVRKAAEENQVFLGELIWREFFMQILFNYPHVVTGNFRSKYNNITWRNNEAEFSRWCKGETGYPIVDAGMRQLNETGYMHNRVRMITAGFLCKHLLTAWWFGEAYFAGKLNDYELSSNNGNWQWAAGTGCDAAPYFRIFNPAAQHKKFDPENEYVRKWVPEFDKRSYPKPMVVHEFARLRATEAYRIGLK